MNKFFAANLSFTLLCLAALLASCEKGSTGSGSGSGSETPPEGGSAQLVLSDPSDKTLSAEGHTFSITFRTNQDWTASSSEEWWCYVYPASGKASDSAISINCEVDENSSRSERSSVITIQAGSLKKSFTVKQQGSEPPAQDYFTLKTLSGKETDLVLMSREGGQTSLMFNTSLQSGEWNLEVEEADWCKVYLDGSLIRMEAEPYGEKYEYLYPRTCKATIKSSKLPDVSFTLAQESYQILRTLNYISSYTLSPSGAPLDVFIYTNYYQWKVRNNSDWFTVEQPDRMTLRVRATPKQEGDTQVRTGSVTLYSAAWSEEDLETIYWNKTVKINFSDGDPDLSGEDYNYGDNKNWD